MTYTASAGCYTTATYSPDDNKLRLYASARLDAETYARVKAAGFKWAPKQDLFVAPMWTPGREDLLLELAGEIGDEDTSLVDRAEQRADRFDDYADRRQDEANRAHDAVQSICDGIPMGQPILVGHHSERHARKDAERIDNGMRKAVKLWDTAKYWERRAKGAIQHAKYKERPDVRHRRIKGIEADKRKAERAIERLTTSAERWRKVAATEPEEAREKLAVFVSGRDESHFSYRFPLDKYPRTVEGASAYEGDMSLYSALTGHVIDGAKAAELAITSCEKSLPHYQRWIAHYDNRLTYERAMLDEQGGTAATKYNLEVGGRILYDGEWLVILRVNKAGETVNSVTATPPRGVTWSKTWKIEAERIRDYKAPSAEDSAKVKKATALPPLCNYPGEGFLHQTKEEYEKTVPRWSDFSKITTLKATEKYGRHRVRQTRKRDGAYYETQLVYLTDQKRVDPPAPEPTGPVVFDPVATEATEARLKAYQPPQPKKPDPDAAKFAALREQAKAGVQVVSAPQLFPTPPELAARMVELAEIIPAAGVRILEPSAGTGAIISALIADVGMSLQRAELVAVEHNTAIASTLKHRFPAVKVRNADFLDCNGDLGTFDRILMNPPFANAEDIKHIKHAMGFLKPGGRLVAICAGGPRQEEQLRPLIENNGGTWEPLPAGTFESSGTGVNSVLLVYDASVSGILILV